MKNKLIGLAAGILFCTATVMADTFPNTLWIGNDVAAAPILNTTTTGIVLRQIDATQAVGLAIDSNKLYVNSTTSGGNIYNLDTLNPGDTFSLPHNSRDMTFSGGFLWAASFGTFTIDKVDPVTGDLVGGFAVDFIPLGVTTDGAGGFWVSGFGAAGQVLRHFNSSFQADADIDTSDIVDGLGGLGFDPRDNTSLSEASARYFTTTLSGMAPIWVSLAFPTEINSWTDLNSTQRRRLLFPSPPAFYFSEP